MTSPPMMIRVLDWSERRSGPSFAMVSLAFLVTVAVSEGQPAPVTTMLQDFQSRTPGPQPSIEYWRWTDAQKAMKEEFSRFEIVEDAISGNRYLEAEISATIPHPGRILPFEMYVLTFTPTSLLPPTADAVRLKVRVLDGSFRLMVGGPTIYYGNSDVVTPPQVVTPSADWQTVEFDLNGELVRNYRRSNFSDNATTLHYTRWLQEPLAVYFVRGETEGTVLIDDIQLVARGEGQNYPEFTESAVAEVLQVADFESETDITRAFNFTHFDSDYQLSYTAANPHYVPAKLARVPEGPGGSHVLELRIQGKEERHFAGIKALGSAASNALQLRMKVENPYGFSQHSIDFILYTAPTDARGSFPWDTLDAPPEDAVYDGFDYNLSRANTAAISYGFYHARRALEDDTWQTVIIPFADCIAAYGNGRMAESYSGQLPLNGEEIFALGLLPSYRQRREETRILIDDVAFVSVPGPPSTHRSFYQPNQASTVDGAGLFFEYFEGDWDTLPDFAALIPSSTGYTSNVDIGPRALDDGFGFRFRGQIEIEEEGEYTFSLDSDDGSQLFINGTLVVDNNVLDPAGDASGKVVLGAGLHAIAVDYFQKSGEEKLNLTYAGPSFGRKAIPDDVLFQPVPGPYEAWLAEQFSVLELADETLRPTVWGLHADPDGDGVTNVREYAFGQLATLADEVGSPWGFIHNQNGKRYVAISFQRPVAADDVRYTVVVSENFSRWEDGHSYYGSDPSPGSAVTTELSRKVDEATGLETIKVRTNQRLDSPAVQRQFIRVDVRLR